MTETKAKSHRRLTIGASTSPRELITERPRIKDAWTAKVITLFPEQFPGVLGASLTGKALDAGIWRLETIDLRVFGEGRHRNVDDTPAGGGAGMVLRADVMARAIRHAMRDTAGDWPLVYLSPRGRHLDQQTARRFAASRGITLVAGRFEGLDERVIEHFGMEEISLGDFVMTGGEIAAEAVVDACVRLLPGVLGNSASATEESFSEGLLEHPQYTRPAEWEGRTIPEVLTSGDHARVTRWREAEAERLTRERRPDLWKAYLDKTGRDDD